MGKAAEISGIVLSDLEIFPHAVIVQLITQAPHDDDEIDERNKYPEDQKGSHFQRTALDLHKGTTHPYTSAWDLILGRGRLAGRGI